MSSHEEPTKAQLQQALDVLRTGVLIPFHERVEQLRRPAKPLSMDVLERATLARGRVGWSPKAVQ